MPYLTIFIPKALEDSNEGLRRDIAGADHSSDPRRYVRALTERKNLWPLFEVERESS
jgi:hypothetical protein